MTVTKNKEIIDQLSKVGLAPLTANIYTFLLEIGSNKTKNTAFYIAKALNLPRSTVYLQLDRLIARSLVSSYKINNVIHFLAEHPNRIQKDLEEKKNIFLDLLPDLEELRKNGNTYSSVRTYTGPEGVKLVFDEIFEKSGLRNLKQLFTISNTKLSEILPKGFPKKLDELKKKYGIHTKMILVPHKTNAIDSVYKNDSNRETRLLPTHYIFDGSLYIYGDKVVFFSLADKEVYSVIIESKTITSMIKNFFTCTWDLLNNN
jgi:sugar-specific transcriptional regulator TrmB